MPDQVLCQVSEGLATLVLNRPEQGNALDRATGRALVVAVERIAGDATVRAVLVTGAGKMFCAGGDIAEMQAAGLSLEAWMGEMIPPLATAVHTLATLPVPVVSAVNGPVAGGGIGLALCADLVLAAESMKLRGGYSGIGLTTDLGSSWFLTQRAGAARAKELLFLNRPLGARECLAWGIVNAVYPDERLAEEARLLARRLAEGATSALGRIKRLVQGAPARPLEEHLALESDSMVAAAGTSDAREGVAAFMAKRPARFTGA